MKIESIQLAQKWRTDGLQLSFAIYNGGAAMKRIQRMVVLVALVLLGCLAASFGGANAAVDWKRVHILDRWNKPIMLFRQNDCISNVTDNPLKGDGSPYLYYRAGSNMPVTLVFPHKCRLQRDALYTLSMEVNTNFSDDCLDKIQLMRLPHKKYKYYYRPYLQLSRLDFISAKGSWKRLSLVFMGDPAMSSVRVFLGKLRKNEYLALRNISIEPYSETETERKNLVNNGDFEYHYFLEDTFPYHFNSIAGWREIFFLFPDCYEAQYGIILSGRESVVLKNKREVLMQSEYPQKINLMTMGGTPDVFLYSGYNDSIWEFPYSGRYYVTINVSNPNYGKISEDKERTYSGEFLQMELKQPLVGGQRYRFSMYYKHFRRSAIYTNALGVLLSSCPYTHMAYNPNDSAEYAKGSFMVSKEVIRQEEWQNFTFEMTAKGDEKYITIGPFRHEDVGYRNECLPKTKIRDWEYGYYCIDAVSLEVVH